MGPSERVPLRAQAGNGEGTVLHTTVGTVGEGKPSGSETI